MLAVVLDSVSLHPFCALPLGLAIKLRTVHVFDMMLNSAFFTAGK